MGIIYLISLSEIINSVDTWRILAILSLLQMIFYKKRIKFLQNSEEKLEHDKSLYIKSELILTPELFKEFLVELSINETYQKPKLVKVKDFSFFIKKYNNKFLNKNIAESVEKLNTEFKNLFNFFDSYYAESDKILDLYCLNDNLKHNADFDYEAFQQKLSKLCKEVEISYTNYRLNIKTHLNICI